MVLSAGKGEGVGIGEGFVVGVGAGWGAGVGLGAGVGVGVGVLAGGWAQPATKSTIKSAAKVTNLAHRIIFLVGPDGSLLLKAFYSAAIPF